MKSFRFAIALALSLNVALRAQDHTTAFDGGPSNPNTVVNTAAANNLALNQALQQQNLQYQADANGLRSELDRANLAKMQCTTAQSQEDLANKIGSAEEAGNQKAAMVQQLMPTIGAMAQQLPKLASKVGAAAKDTMKALEQEGGAGNRFHILKKTVGQSVRFAADEGACEEEFGTDKVQVESCINKADRRASQMNEQYAQAKRDAAGSGDLMGPLLTAGLAGAALAYGNSVRTQTAALTAPLQAQLSAEKKAACLSEADLAIADVNRRMAQLQKNRDFNLSTIANQFKLPRSVIDNLAVPVIDPLAVNSNSGPLAAAAAGGGLVPYVAPFTKEGGAPAAGGGSGGGGGGGGGGASGGSDLAWTYGGNGGSAGGGSIPAQPGETSFDGGGGGNVFAAAGAASAEGGLNTGLEYQTSTEGQQGGFAVGDGGMRLMMARARLRLSNHQTELLRDLDLRTMAKSSSEEPNREISSLKK